MGSPLIRQSMISLLQSFPPSKEIDELPYCGLSSSKEVDDFLPAGFSQVMKLMISLNPFAYCGLSCNKEIDDFLTAEPPPVRTSMISLLWSVLQ